MITNTLISSFSISMSIRSRRAPLLASLPVPSGVLATTVTIVLFTKSALITCPRRNCWLWSRRSCWYSFPGCPAVTIPVTFRGHGVNRFCEAITISGVVDCTIAAFRGVAYVFAPFLAQPVWYATNLLFRRVATTAEAHGDPCCLCLCVQVRLILQLPTNGKCRCAALATSVLLNADAHSTLMEISRITSKYIM